MDNYAQINMHYCFYLCSKGFLETGVERIVDQVVNPKINTVFLPKVEDISYKCMGVEKPKERRMKAIKVDTNQLGFLPNLDLEQVSPDSSSKSKSPGGETNFDDNGGLDDSDDKMDEFESPAFEPLESFKTEDNNEDSCIDMDIAVSEDMDYEMKDSNVDKEPNNDCFQNDDAKSNLSSISGLTSNGSSNDGQPIDDDVNAKAVEIKEELGENTNKPFESVLKIEETSRENQIELTICEQKPNQEGSSYIKEELALDASPKIDVKEEEHDAMIENINQDSVLSQVSSNSRLSIITTNNNTNTRDDEVAQNAQSLDANCVDGTKLSVENSVRDLSLCDIGEDAQMQKFNDSSSSDTSGTSGKNASSAELDSQEKLTSFDIRKDEIKFEGTERTAFHSFDESQYKLSDTKENSDTEVKSVSKFEPSNFNIRPSEVCCSDLLVDNVKTTMSDVFDNSSQSQSNNLIIVENDEEASAKSRDLSQFALISPLAQDSSHADEKNSSLDKISKDEKNSPDEKSSSAERKNESSSGRSKHHGDSKISSSSRGSSSSHNGKDKNKDRTSSSTSSKEKGSSSSSKDKYRKSVSSHSSSSKHRSPSKSSVRYFR